MAVFVAVEVSVSVGVKVCDTVAVSVGVSVGVSVDVEVLVSVGVSVLVRVSVADNGPGIPPQIVKRIFDPFFTTKPVGSGTGLGLSLVREIIQQHGGDVTVQSRPGEGARFTVSLPATVVTSSTGELHAQG